MKLALRYLPTEVWVDVFIFPWITRKKLGKIVHMFRNRYFAEILQYCLHERGSRTLGTLYLIKDAPIPQSPMPENIKFFELITIDDFDAQTLDFLRRISTLFATNDVNLFFDSGRHNELTNLRTTFDHLCPMLHGVNSMEFNQSAIPLVQQYFGPKLPQIKMISINFERDNPATIDTDISFCLDWLTSGEQDINEPKFLHVYINWEIIQKFTDAVKQHFLSAKEPGTYWIALLWYGNNNNDRVAKFQLENDIGEQLDGYNTSGIFRLYRRPKGFSRGIGKAFEKRDSSAIKFYLTNGQIDGNADANEVINADIEEEAGPSSKKPKLA